MAYRHICFATSDGCVAIASTRELTSSASSLLRQESAIYLTDYGDSAIEYTLYCWVAPEHYWAAAMALRENLRTTFQEAGVEMTYNHLNVHIVENRG